MKLKTVEVMLEDDRPCLKESLTDIVYDGRRTDCPELLYEVIEDMDLHKCATEHIYMFMLDNKNKILCISEVGHGSVNACPAGIREIAQTALLAGATGVVLCHNHPSGDPSPSDFDILATVRISKGLELVGLKLLDHFVVGRENERAIFSPIPMDKEVA